jgi:hypothetical protein
MSGTKDEQPGFAVCAAATASLMRSRRGMPFPSGSVTAAFVGMSSPSSRTSRASSLMSPRFGRSASR